MYHQSRSLLHRAISFRHPIYFSIHPVAIRCNHCRAIPLTRNPTSRISNLRADQSRQLFSIVLTVAIVHFHFLATQCFFLRHVWPFSDGLSRSIPVVRVAHWKSDTDHQTKPFQISFEEFASLPDSLLQWELSYPSLIARGD